MRQKVLFIGIHWPEPSTGAGTRMFQLLQSFLAANYQVLFSSTAEETELSYPLEDFNIKKVPIQLNHASFDSFISNLQPNIVVFDRFLSEEQFGWRVTEHAPNALRILDTEDLHSLRHARLEAFKAKIPFTINQWLQSSITKREIASIYRCDLSLIISSVEMELLITELKIDKSLLLHLPFMVEKISQESIEDYPNFEVRKDFIFVGNGKHAPNIDAIKWLKTAIWPKIRSKLPNTQLHIYGAYMPQQIKEMQQPNEGFLVRGYTADLQYSLSAARINFAPLRFGAGQKGKLIEAMRFGTPSVSTSLGAEGITEGLSFGGIIADTEEKFVNAAVAMYQNKDEFLIAQQHGYHILETNFDGPSISNKMLKRIQKMQDQLVKHRNSNFMGALLHYHTLQSTKYMSKWIEEKKR